MPPSTLIAPFAAPAEKPIPSIHLMENHDTAYDLWTAAGVQNRTLLHFDGHLDFYWMDEPISRASLRKSIDIGNFIYPAIRQGVVSQFYWVIPDPFWKSPEERRILRSWMDLFIAGRPAACGPLVSTAHGFELTVLGRPLIVTTLAGLPTFSDPVLLDIDVDYLLTWGARKEIPYYDRHYPGPWIWPTEFLQRLREKNIPTDFLTIAYSVEGGFTPLDYKYFGDLLQATFARPEKSITDRPEKKSAAELYPLCREAVEKGNVAAARRYWVDMVKRDPSYHTRFAIPGAREERAGRWRSALSIYETLLKIAPGWSEAHLGKGRALLRLRQWKKAETALSKARRLSKGPTAATYWLGRCAAHRQDWKTAEKFWTLAVRESVQDTLSFYALSHLALRRKNYVLAVQFARKAQAGITQDRHVIAHHPSIGGHTMQIPQDILGLTFEKNKRVVTRKVAGEIILVPLLNKIPEGPVLFTLDEVAAFLWDQLDGQRTGKDLVVALQDTYTVETKQATQDVQHFLEQLQDVQVIQPCSAVTA